MEKINFLKEAVHLVSIRHLYTDGVTLNACIKNAWFFLGVYVTRMKRELKTRKSARPKALKIRKMREF